MKTNRQKNILKKMCKQEKTMCLKHFLIIVKKQIDFNDRLNLNYSINRRNKIKLFKNNNIMFLVF